LKSRDVIIGKTRRGNFFIPEKFQTIVAKCLVDSAADGNESPKRFAVGRLCMSDEGETQQYEASLLTKGDELHRKKFVRLTDAILWLSAQFTADNNNAEQGAIFYDGAVIWRKRNYPLPNDSPSLAPARQEPSEAKPALVPILTETAENICCPNCDGSRWVCGNHPDRPWKGVSALANACECGDGMPCPMCNEPQAGTRPEIPPQFGVMADKDKSTS